MFQCSICKRDFHTAGAKIEHEKDHRTYGTPDPNSTLLVANRDHVSHLATEPAPDPGLEEKPAEPVKWQPKKK